MGQYSQFCSHDLFVLLLNSVFIIIIIVIVIIIVLVVVVYFVIDSVRKLLFTPSYLYAPISLHGVMLR